jgi:dihydroorotate dehydrogenase (fumarate)
MNLVTKYLGMTLQSPLVVSANPLSEKIDNIKRMEDAGAGAVVLFSLFEEQLNSTSGSSDLHRQVAYGVASDARALDYFPELEKIHTGPDAYLEHIRRAKAAVTIPIIASLNAVTPGDWVEFASLIEHAGADALELNVYYVPTRGEVKGAFIEQEYIDILRTVKESVRLPIALKLSPYFTNLANMAESFAENGADGLVLFNRFYQPDIDLETGDISPNVQLSNSNDLRLPLRWIAILRDELTIDLAASSGIHTAQDVLKMVMVGANVTMMASALLSNGIDHLRTVDHDLRAWLEQHGYDSISQVYGKTSQKHSKDPDAFERAQYMRALTTYQK